MTSPSDRDPDFEAWLAEQERRQLLEDSPKCPDCGKPMIFELKNGEFSGRKMDGYYMRPCRPCGKIWALVRGEMKEWRPKE